MKEWRWVVKHAFLDMWEAKRALAIRAMAVVGALCAFAMAGAGSWGLWDMVPVEGSVRQWTEHARVSSCEKELAGLPDRFRVANGKWGGFETLSKGREVRFACRKDLDGEWVERRRQGDGVRGLLRERPELKGWERLDDLSWQEFRPELSLKGWEESMGLAELTEASRGFAASTDAAAESSVSQWVWRSSFGIVLAFFLILIVMVSNVAATVGLAVASAAAVLTWREMGKRAPGLGRRIKALASATAGVLAPAVLIAMGLAGMAVLALADPSSERLSMMSWDPEAGLPVMRYEELADCDARLAKERLLMEDPQREKIKQKLICRKEGERMLLVSLAPKELTDEKAREEARLFLRLGDSRLSKGRVVEPKASWGAFVEIAGWAPASSKNRDWAGSVMRPGGATAGVTGWKGRIFVGWLVCAAMGWLICVGYFLWMMVRSAPCELARAWERNKQRVEALAASSEFQARAQKRELDKGTRGAVSEEKRPGKLRL